MHGQPPIQSFYPLTHAAEAEVSGLRLSRLSRIESLAIIDHPQDDVFGLKLHLENNASGLGVL